MYINTSDEFDNLIRQSGRTFHAKLVNGVNVIDDIRSVSLYQASNSSDNIGIGGCITSYIECKIGATAFELENVEYELQIGMELSDKTVEYVPMGLYTPNKPTIQGEITSFIAYDRVKKLSGAYFSNIENYPTDSKNILAEISQMTGILIDCSSLDDGVMIDKRIVMTDVSVNEDGEEVESKTYEKPFTGYTHQEAIAYIAQLHGKFAQTNRSGNVIFKWFSHAESQLEITRSQYMGDMQLAEKEFVLGVIHCSTSDGNLVCGAGAIGISIDNPVMTQALLENVYNKIGGFKCRALTMNYNGDIRLDIGDIVSVYTQTGIMDVPIMKMETIYDGGIHQVIHAFGDTDSTEPSKGPTAQRLDRMYSELLLVKEVMANKISAETLKVRIAEMGYASIDELTVEVAKMGLMTAAEADIKYMTVSSADMKYATIDLSNIAVGTITDAMIANGAIGTAQIADGSITDAKIVGLTANKITAGTLDAGTIEVVNLNAANITVGTINGHQIASGAISLDNLANDVTNKLADTEAEVAQAVADAKQAILSSDSAISVANTADSNASTALSTANTAKTTANAAKKNTYASFDGGGKSNGYFKVATLKIAGSYVNRDIVIGAISRGYGYTTVQIMFSSVNNTDPSLTYFKQNGRGDWYIYKSATSTWEIYCKKNEAYGSCQIVDYVSCSNITLTWNGSEANTDLPSGATRATQLAGQAAWCYNNNISYLNGGVIYAGTVVANAIAAGAITADKIATDAVTAVKIAAGAITTDKLDANAVTAAKIASGTITATQIAASTITGGKIASSTITSTNIASSAITTDKLVASAVTSAKIAAGAITTEKLAANAVTAAKIAAGTITATQIASGTITSDKLNVTSLSAISANLGTVTAGVIKSTNYAANSTGMKLDLSTGVWDSKYFKLSNTGAITATSGKIGCFNLSSTGLTNSVLKIISNGSNTAQLSVYHPSITDPIFDVVMSGSWNYFVAKAMNEIVLSADDVYLTGNVWVKNDVSTEDGISLRALNSNLIPSGSINLLFQFGTNSNLGTYYTPSLYVPKNIKLTLTIVNFMGSTGNFVEYITLNRSGNFIFLTTTNPNLSGLLASCICEVS